MVKVREYGDGAVVSATDARRQFGTVFGEVLADYGTLYIEKGDDIIAQVSTPPEDAGPTVQVYGDDSEE